MPHIRAAKRVYRFKSLNGSERAFTLHASSPSELAEAQINYVVLVASLARFSGSIPSARHQRVP
jgi:hypothetical protein